MLSKSRWSSEKMYCCHRKSQAGSAQSFALWQQATIEITCRDHSIIACSRHIYVVLFFTHIPFVVNHTFNAMPMERLQQYPLLFTTNRTDHILFYEGRTWYDLHILVTAPFCCDREARAGSVQNFALWQQAPIEITCRDHSIIACSRHIYVVLFFTHIPFVVNHTFNATPMERLQQYQQLSYENCAVLEKTAKAFAISMNMKEILVIHCNSLRKSSWCGGIGGTTKQSTVLESMCHPYTNQIFNRATYMLEHCTEKFQCIHFVSISSETIAKQQKVMRTQFDQTSTIKGTQSFYYFRSIYPTPIRMKRKVPFTIILW